MNSIPLSKITPSPRWPEDGKGKRLLKRSAELAASAAAGFAIRFRMDARLVSLSHFMQKRVADRVFKAGLFLIREGRRPALPAPLRFSFRCLAAPCILLHKGIYQFSILLFRASQEYLIRRMPKTATMVPMVSAVLVGGSYCGDRISVPADASRLTRPDGSVYLWSPMKDGKGRQIYMLRLGRPVLDLPGQAGLS